jgi:murein DD-endopeptidase MepM/ murein hydrolase activator NlpD
MNDNPMSTHHQLIQKPSRRIGRFIRLGYLVVFTALLAACRSLQPNSSTPYLVPPATYSPQVTETATPPATATTVVYYSNSAPLTTAPYPTTVVMDSAGVPPIARPTQTEIPISTWRPPLYPNPWAPTLYDHFYFTSPISANEANSTVSDYRYGGVFFEDVVHTGVDIPAQSGTPILAAGPGTVVWAGYGVFQGGYDTSDPYGLAVTLRHDFGYQNQMLYTIYGHMSEIDVVVGQHVETGDRLGLVGETGKVTGPHLHFEVRIGDNTFFTTRNPELWLVPPIGWGIIAGQMTDTVGQPIYDQQLIITDPQHEQNWLAWSYGKTAANSDPYYQENLVIGDLPAGNYLLRTAFGGVNYSIPIQVYPGMVSYFYFRGYDGFKIAPPPAPGADFTPAPALTPIP